MTSTTGPRIGSLFSGAGGLDLAVLDVLGGTVVWHSQYEPPDKKGRPDKHQYAARILAHHWPQVPNLGDITAVDWDQVLDEHGPVDVLIGGFPCQDVSLAGKRAGLSEGTRTGLWFEVLRSISTLRPGLVVLENVPGLLTKGVKDEEPNDRCVCGWPYRRGGLHRDIGAARLVLNPGADRDDLQSQGSTADDAEDLRRIDLPVQGEDEPLGVSGDVDSDWSGGGSLPGAGSTVSQAQAGAGRDRPEGSGDPRWAAGATAGAPLDGGGEGALCRTQAPDARAEPEGAFDAATGEPISDCEACGRPVGDGSSRPVLRSGMGAVLRSLASVGFHAEWRCLRASDTGAPHRRERVFVLGWPAAEDPDVAAGGQRRLAAPRQAESGRPRADFGGRGGAPAAHPGGRGRGTAEPDLLQGQPDARWLAPADTEGRPGRIGHGDDVRAGGAAVRRDAPAGRGADADPTGLGRGEGGAEPARQQGRPDPALSGGEPVADPDSGRFPEQPERDSEPYRGEADDLRDVPDAVRRDDAPAWGPYAAAVGRWEHILGRAAPQATDDRGRLNPAFVEWMMGLPAGHVTGVPGLPRTAQLKALGNGVVPQQAAAALRLLLARMPGLSAALVSA